jgi:PAS domain S-box-containing protein
MRASQSCGNTAASDSHMPADQPARSGTYDAEMFKRLVEAVRDYAIFLLDPTGRVATWNVGAERIKGYRPSDIIGQHFSVFYPDSPGRDALCAFELEVAAREGRFEDEGWRVRKDGSRFWANVVISAVRDDDGGLLAFSKVTRDLTERKLAMEEQAARLAAEQANKAKDEFLAMLGHELRNPLAPIVTALQLMKLRSDHQTSKEQEVIERQVKHMMRLVDDLLDVSRITRGLIPLERRHLDVRDVVAKAIEVASPMLEERRHHLAIDSPQHPIMVDGDEGRLMQIFVNVLLNAAKYTDSGGHIAVSVTESEREARIEVRDDGRGIDRELLPRVFDLFTQGHQSSERSVGGLGIGLALVRTLTQMHGGSVEAHSAGPGHGSAFAIRLPVAVVGEQPAVPPPSALELGTARKKHRILLVDDNEDALILLAQVLSAVGHEVHTASDPVMALQLVKALDPDVAILDIGLPVMDGYALAPLLRAELRHGRPRLIALTGYGQKNDRERSRNAGFDAHLVKPIDAQRLLQAIEALDGEIPAEPPASAS